MQILDARLFEIEYTLYVTVDDIWYNCTDKTFTTLNTSVFECFAVQVRCTAWAGHGRDNVLDLSIVVRGTAS